MVSKAPRNPKDPNFTFEEEQRRLTREAQGSRDIWQQYLSEKELGYREDIKLDLLMQRGATLEEQLEFAQAFPQITEFSQAVDALNRQVDEYNRLFDEGTLPDEDVVVETFAQEELDTGMERLGELPETLTSDEGLLYQEYLRTGGTLDVGRWVREGSPIRPLDVELTVGEEQSRLFESMNTVFPDLTPEAVLEEAMNNFPSFIESIREKGRTEDTEQLLKRFGFDEADIEQIFEPQKAPGIVVTEETKDLFYGVFPKGLNVDAFLELGQENPEKLLQLIWMRGDTEASRNLIKSLWPQATEEVIDTIFDEPKQNYTPAPTDDDRRRILRQGGVDETEIEKIVELNKLDLTSEEWLQKWKDIDISVWKDVGYSVIGRSFFAGLGNLLEAGAGAATWAKQETLANSLFEAGEVLTSGRPPSEPFNPDEWWNPQFWMTSGVEMMTFSLAMIPFAVLAASAAPVLGLGATATTVLAILFGATGGAVAESVIEAGATYNEAKRRDFTDEEASEAFSSVFWKDMQVLTGTNALEFFAAFMPAPARTLTKLTTKGWVRVIRTGAKIGSIALTEAGQEVLQEIASKRALGDEVVWDDEMKMVAIVGGTMGLALGGAANVFTTIQSKVKARMTPEQLEQFDANKADFIEQGLSDEQADLKAMDTFAETTEGKTVVEEVTEDVRQEEIATIIKPQDNIEALAWEHISKQGEEQAPTPTTEAVVTSPEVRPEVVKTGQEYTATVYRGSKEGVAPTDEGLFGKGTYFSSSREYAETYGEVETSAVTLKNPYVITSQAEYAELQDMGRNFRQQALAEGMVDPRQIDDFVATKIREELEGRGHDGVIARDIIAKGDEVVVFHPETAVSKPPTPPPAEVAEVPTAEPGMPEAGLQKGMFGAPPAEQIKEWESKGYTKEDVESLSAMTPELRELTTHPARMEGFRNVSADSINDYLQKLLNVAKQRNNKRAINDIETAIEYNDSGLLQSAVFDSESALNALHMDEIAALREAQRLAWIVVGSIPPDVDIEAVQKDAFVEVSPEEDIVRAGKDAFNAQAEAAGLPPPNIPPGAIGHIGSGGNNSENSLYDMANSIIPGEDAGRAALRLWDGTRNRMATETVAWWRSGSKFLKDLGIGQTDGMNQRLTKEDSLELFKALHGEGEIAGELEPIYHHLKAELDQEASDMLAFDPTFSRVLMAHPDYFPRGWRPPKEGARLRLGAKPGFLKPRVDATFTEMIEAGWEPLSWNPYDMAALRVMAGTEYREGSILIKRLKTHNKAIAEHEAPRDGWRVPKVGPAFEGKPYVRDGKAYMTPKIAVPNRVADVLESIYGVPVEFRVKGVNIWKAISAFGSVTKRAKLFASLFQHVDFLTRDLIVAFSPEGIRHGVPLKMPAFVSRAMWSSVSPTSRARLETRILSGDPLYVDSDISLRMVADKGWKLGQDELLIRRDVRANLERTITEAQEEGLTVSTMGQVIKGVTIVTDPVTKRLASVARFFEAGLFDGMYRESQAFALEHVFIPRLRRLHPTWTTEQIAGSAAEEVNKQFSTLGVWQSVIQQPAVREAARALFFSFNESESLIRQGTSAFVGQNRRYWQEFTLSTFYTLALVANVINLISEGEPLPPDRYVPVKFGSSWSSMPWGIAYNDKFLAPRLPWNGRNNQPLYLDIVGQMDTFLRWILDPASALTARVNVFPRAVMNQAQGRDFWGRDLTDWKDRTRQALVDLFMPIGAGNLVEAGRLLWPPVGEVFPEAEGRIGVVGALIQATGLNVRAQNTLDMLDRYARGSGLLKADGTPVQSWSDLEPHQKKEFATNEELQTELGLRSVASVERNYPGSLGFSKLDELDQERITRGEALIAELIGALESKERGERFDVARDFRVEVSRLKREIANRKSQVNKDFELFKDTGILPDDPNKRALVEYYNMYDKALKPSGVMDWEKVDELEAELRDKWTIGQEDYVDRNIGLTDWGPLMQEFIDAQRTLSDSGYYDAEARDRRVFRYLHPEIEEIISGKFYNQKPIEEEAEKISLKWNDVYRQFEAVKDTFKEMSDAELNKLPSPEGISAEDWTKMNPDKKQDALIDFGKETIYNENPGFWEDDQKRDAWNKGFGETLIQLYTDRAALVRETSPNSPIVKVFMLDHPELYEKGLELEVWEKPDTPWNEPVLRISAKWAVEDEEYDAGIPERFVNIENPDARNAAIAQAREEYYAALPEYYKDVYRRKAYSITGPKPDYGKFPDNLVETYVDYYTNPDLKKPDYLDEGDLWYEDDWWLMEHADFEDTMVGLGEWKEKRDLSKVPTRKVFHQYQVYLALPRGTQRKAYRLKYPEFDAWLVLKFDYTPATQSRYYPTMEERWEELAEDIVSGLERSRGLTR